MQTKLVLVGQSRELVIKRGTAIVILVRAGIVHLVRMVIQAPRLRNVAVELHQEPVMRVVRQLINIVVAVLVIVRVVARHVTVSIQVVHVRRIIHGTEVLVYAIVVSNMRVAVLERQVPVRYVVESISYVYVRLIMYRFVT